MIPPPFDYSAPTTLEEALSLLKKHGDEAKILSGGQSLIPLLKMRMAAPAHLVDLNRIPNLDYIRDVNGDIRIGCLAREASLEKSELVARCFPLLVDAAAVIADPIVRNRATVCGNLAHGDPANDHPAVMLALEAHVVARGPDGERVIPVSTFFPSLFTTDLRPDEILTEVRLKKPAPGSGGAYFKLERKVGDFATAAVAAQVTIQGGSCSHAGVGLTNVGPTPIKATQTETFLRGKTFDEATLKEAGRIASTECSPSEDRRGSVDYKRDLVRVLTMRALRRAYERATRGGNN